MLTIDLFALCIWYRIHEGFNSLGKFESQQAMVKGSFKT